MKTSSLKISEPSRHERKIIFAIGILFFLVVFSSFALSAAGAICSISPCQCGSNCQGGGSAHYCPDGGYEITAKSLASNTVNDCRDGCDTRFEWVDNVYVTDLNDSVFRAGDTVSVTVNARCNLDWVGIAYNNGSDLITATAWNTIFAYYTCTSSNVNYTVNFTLQNRTGNHTFRGMILYDRTENFTCAHSGDPTYSDTDDVSVVVQSALPDTAPPEVSIASPTPTNGSIITSLSLQINISHNETNPSALVLTWNNTNETYSFSGSSTLITKTILQRGNYTFSVFMNDTKGNTNQTVRRTVSVVPYVEVVLSAPANVSSHPQARVPLNISIQGNGGNISAKFYSLNGAANTTITNRLNISVTVSDAQGVLNETNINQLNLSQSFVVPETMSIQNISLRLQRIGAGADSRVELRGDSSGRPSTQILGVANVVNATVSSGSFSWLEVELNATAVLTGGSRYWIFLNGTGNTTNSYLWEVSDDNLTLGYAGHNASRDFLFVAYDRFQYREYISAVSGTNNLTITANTTNGSYEAFAIQFIVDTSPPTYSEANRTYSILEIGLNQTIMINITDSIGVSAAWASYFSANYSMTRTSGNNYEYTFKPNNTIIWNYTIYMNDSAGNENSTGILNFTVNDTVVPLTANFSNTPNSTDAFDPGVIIFVTFNVSDDGILKAGLLQYRNETAPFWANATMLETSDYGLYGNFTPDVQMNWSYRVFFNDSKGNANFSRIVNLSVAVDYSWNIVPANISAIGGVLSTTFTYLNLTINNTGDSNLSLNISQASDSTATIGFNYSSPLTISNNTYRIVQVNLTVPAIVGNYIVSLNVNATQGNATPSFAVVNTTLLAHTGGAYLTVSITGYDSSVNVGDHFDLAGEITNIGNDTAVNAQSLWDLPTGWSTNPAKNRTIGNMSVGNVTTFRVTVDVNSTVASTGTFVIILNANTTNRDASDNRTVTVSNPNQSTLTTSTITTSAGSSSGGGLPQKEILVNFTDSLDVLKGQSASVAFQFKNVFAADEVVNDAKLLFEGYEYGQIIAHPKEVGGVSYNNYGRFDIEVNAPDYLEERNYQVNVTLLAKRERFSSGKRVSSREVNDKRKLIIHVISTEANSAISQKETVEKGILDLRGKGYNTFAVEEYYAEAVALFESGKYNEARRLFDKIIQLQQKAEEVNASLSLFRQKLEDGLTQGLNVRSSMRYFKNALRAFKNGRFDEADASLEKAKLASFIEVSVGGFGESILSALGKYWYLAVGFTLLGFSVFFVLRRNLQFAYTTQKLSSLDKNERTLLDKVLLLQKEYFVQHLISKKIYDRTVDRYYERLVKINEEGFNVRARRLGLLQFLSRLDVLLHEKEFVRDALEELQRKYYQKNLMPEKVYRHLLRSYSLRLAEIEKDLRQVRRKA